LKVFSILSADTPCRDRSPGLDKEKGLVSVQYFQFRALKDTLAIRENWKQDRLFEA
jgi:hypothetical protein